MHVIFTLLVFCARASLVFWRARKTIGESKKDDDHIQVTRNCEISYFIFERPITICFCACMSIVYDDYDDYDDDNDDDDNGYGDGSLCTSSSWRNVLHVLKPNWLLVGAHTLIFHGANDLFAFAFSFVRLLVRLSFTISNANNSFSGWIYTSYVKCIDVKYRKISCIKHIQHSTKSTFVWLYCLLDVHFSFFV